MSRSACASASSSLSPLVSRIRPALRIALGIGAGVLFWRAAPCLAQTNTYLWLGGDTAQCTIASRIAPPEGFRRTQVPPGSFADWLRHLPLKEDGARVLLHNGTEKPNQNAHVAVIAMDTGMGDLQQCADAVIRLRAEYLYSRGQYSAIHFNFTSGDTASFTRWISGYRPSVNGSNVSWARRADQDSSYSSLRAYLNTVFAYAGTHSLTEELRPKQDLTGIEIGDVFIRGGFPGHVVFVVDVVENERRGEKTFLLAQGFVPAQDVHVLKNPTDPRLSPWYMIPSGPQLVTPEWVFGTTQLKCFEAHEP